MQFSNITRKLWVHTCMYTSNFTMCLYVTTLGLPYSSKSETIIIVANTIKPEQRQNNRQYQNTILCTH